MHANKSVYMQIKTCATCKNWDVGAFTLCGKFRTSSLAYKCVFEGHPYWEPKETPEEALSQTIARELEAIAARKSYNFENQEHKKEMPKLSKIPDPEPPLELSDLYSIAFPFDPIQEHFAGIYKQIDKEHKKRMEMLDRVKVKPAEHVEPVEVLDKPKVNLEAFQDWLDCEKQVAICYAWIYAVILIAGIFLAFPVSIENGTRFLIDMTAIWCALFLLYTSASLIFAIFASRRKEK